MLSLRHTLVGCRSAASGEPYEMQVLLLPGLTGSCVFALVH